MALAEERQRGNAKNNNIGFYRSVTQSSTPPSDHRFPLDDLDLSGQMDP